MVIYNKLIIEREKIEECDKKEAPRGLDRRQIKNLSIGNGVKLRESKKQRCAGNETYPTNLYKQRRRCSDVTATERNLVNELHELGKTCLN